MMRALCALPHGGHAVLVGMPSETKAMVAGAVALRHRLGGMVGLGWGARQRQRIVLRRQLQIGGVQRADGGVVLAEMVRQVDCGGVVGGVVADVVRGLAALVNANVDLAGHGHGLQLEVVRPDAVVSHLADVLIEALLLVDEVLVVVCVREEIVAGELAQLDVLVLGAVELVGDGAEEAVAIVCDVANEEAGGAKQL
ncbi:hypothetical protein FGB62_45g177 [Gracilaria domingensis]|nr:hypothetical protein FGB62_45g177 [Gracilaria domingensis]